MPPKWALGYMQSHRTLEDETQMLGIVDTFRVEADPGRRGDLPRHRLLRRAAGTRGSRRSTSTPTSSSAIRKAVLADMHARNVKVVVHMVPWDRDRLPTLHGTIPAQPGETLDASHIQTYWQQHVGLVNAGVDAFWPDEGDWFNLFERIKRHQLYYQGQPVDDSRTCGRGACIATAIPASRSGAAGCGRATPSRRGRRSRRRSPSASTTR